MDVFETIHERRSIRKYRAEAVDRAVLEALLFAAVQAPTPPVSGAAPWALCVIEGRERLAGYGDRAKQYARSLSTEAHPLAWAERPDFEVFWGAPAAVLFCARNGNPEAPFDCCRAAQNFMLAAHASALGSCWVGAPLPWLGSLGVAQELGLPAGFEPMAVIIVGHPAEQPPGSPRPPPPISWC